MLVPKSKIYLAFPGMGKTPLARLIPGFVDADFGNYRTLMKVDKKDERKLLLPFSQFIASIEAKAILTNEPKLAEYIKIDKMYLPGNLKYSAKKMKVSEEQIAEWITGWQQIASKYNIPVVFIKVGLDHYFIKSNLTTMMMNNVINHKTHL